MGTITCKVFICEFATRKLITLELIFQSNAPSSSSTKPIEKTPSKPQVEIPEEYNEKQEEEEPLEKSVIDNFTEKVLPGKIWLLPSCIVPKASQSLAKNE